MRIVFAGAAGYIESHFVDASRKDGAYKTCRAGVTGTSTACTSEMLGS